MHARWIALLLAILFTIPIDASAESRRMRIRKHVPAPLPIGGCNHPDLGQLHTTTSHLYTFDINDYFPVRNRAKPDYCLEMWSHGLTTALYEGKYANTIELAYRIYGAKIDEWASNPGAVSRQQQRIAYVVALAVLRTDGLAARVGNGHRPFTMPEVQHESRAVRSKDPAANLSWAVRTLESLATVGWVDQMHLAEAREVDPELVVPGPKRITVTRQVSSAWAPKNAPEHHRYKDYVRALNNAQYVAVVDAAYEEFGYAVNGWAFNPGAANWSQRGIAYVVALAVLRSEGQLSRNGITDAAANMKWATRTLESLAMTGRVREIHLAEAWGRDPASQDVALQVLEKHHANPGLKHPAQILLLERLYRLKRQT